MSSAQQIADLLKVAKDIPILNTGINDTATEYSTYPVKEHARLLSSSGKPISTPLNSLLSFRNVKIPTDKNDPNYTDRNLLENYKKNALTLTFRGTRTAPASRVEWEEYYLHLVPLVIEHPKILLSENKNLTTTMTKLYRASSDFIGDASLNVEQRSILKVKSLCLPILANDPWVPGRNEDDEISAIVLEEMGLQLVPRNTVANQDERRKYDNMVVQYENAMIFLRELLNHTFLRAIYYTSTRQAQSEYKEVQRTFVTRNALQQNPTIFTARHIIDHIEANCICDNSKALIQIKNGISALIRYKGQDLVSWFQTFQPPVNRYRKAIGLNTRLTDDDVKALWKEHFARQITVSEQTVIRTFQAAHLTAQEIATIATLHDGKFDDTVLYRLLTALATSFESYNPDNTVMIYLKQHSQALKWEHKFDFRPPKEKERDNSNPKNNESSHKKEDRSQKRKEKYDRKSSKSKRIKMTDKASPNPKRIKASEQCRRKSCRQRNTHTNHTHEDCKFKESSGKNHPNLGKAPAKKQRNAKTNSSQPVKNAQAPQAKDANGPKCYVCGQPDHLANACPSKGKIKANAQASLHKNRSFMALWQSSFADDAQQKCASRILKSWGDDVCPTCLQELSFEHRCDPSDIAIAKHTDSVRNVFRSTALLDSIQSAHAFERADTEKPSPISMGPNFFLDAGGQNESNSEDESAQSNDSSSSERDSDQRSDSESAEDSYDDPPYPSDSDNPDIE